MTGSASRSARRWTTISFGICAAVAHQLSKRSKEISLFVWERRKRLSLTIEREAFDPTIIQFGKWKETMMESPLQLPELDRHEATSLEDARFRKISSLPVLRPLLRSQRRPLRKTDKPPSHGHFLRGYF